MSNLVVGIFLTYSGKTSQQKFNLVFQFFSKIRKGNKYIALSSIIFTDVSLIL